MVTLRNYQKEAVRAIIRGFRTFSNQLLVAATGAGKTIIFSELAAMGKGRILVLAHRTELINQAAKTLSELSGKKVSIERAKIIFHSSSATKHTMRFPTVGKRLSITLTQKFWESPRHLAGLMIKNWDPSSSESPMK